MSKFIGVVLGGLAVIAGAALAISTGGFASPLEIAIIGSLLTAGGGTLLTGISTAVQGGGPSDPKSFFGAG